MYNSSSNICTPGYEVPSGVIEQPAYQQPYYANQMIPSQPVYYYPQKDLYPVGQVTVEDQNCTDNNPKQEKKNGLKKFGTGIAKVYGSVFKTMSDGITKISTKVIEKGIKNQTSDFKNATNAYFHRNQYVPQMQYFDDTYVSTFEVCLSLEFQMAYKSDDPKAYLKEKCPAFTLDYLDPGFKFLVGNVGSMRVYCFRGTRTPNDVTIDLKAVPKPIACGSVHKGFYDRFDQVITKYPVPNNTTRILVTGHSLGGGASQCGYLMLKLLYPSIPVVCVTFGCPCCVSPEIVTAIEEPREIVNFVDEGDYIPTITVEKFTKKKFDVMITDPHSESVISVDDFIPYRKMITTAVEMLCHYHPVGVYYYLPLPLKGYAKRPLRCRTEEHFDFLYESQYNRGLSKFAYHMVNAYYERMYRYVFNNGVIWENFDYSIPWLNPEYYKRLLEEEKKKYYVC